MISEIHVIFSQWLQDNFTAIAISSVCESLEDTIVKMKTCHIIFHRPNIAVVFQEEKQIDERPDSSLNLHVKVENWI